jgi:hypothetical protein
MHEAGFTQTSISPRQNDSLKTALLAKQTINGISLFYCYTKYNQLTKSTTRNSQFVIRNYSYDYHISDQIATVTQVGTALDESVRTSYNWNGLALICKSTGTNAPRRTEFTNEPAVTYVCYWIYEEENTKHQKSSYNKTFAVATWGILTERRKINE